MHEWNVLEDKEEDAGDDERVRRDGSYLSELAADLDTDTIQGTRVLGAEAVQGGHPLLRKDTCEEGAHHAPNAVELEDIQTLIDTEELVETLDRRADDTSEEANQGSDPNRDETCGRSDADKTSDGTRASTHDAEFALGADEIDKHPAENTAGGSGVGVEGGHHGTDSGVKRRSTIETEPSEPDENGTKKYKSWVMGFVVYPLTLVVTLSKNESVSQRSPTTGDVDRASSSKIEGWQVVQPAIGVPCPACDWAVNNGGPEEGKDQRWKDAATLEGASNHDLDSAGAEQHLIEAEDDLGDVDRAGRGSGDNVLHAEVGQVTNEGVGSARVGKRVTPEHPLEADAVSDISTCQSLHVRGMDLHAADHEGLEQHGQSRLSPGKAAIHETDTGDDQPNDGTAEQEVGVVELKSRVLSIDIDIERVAAIRLARVEDGLAAVSVVVQMR